MTATREPASTEAAEGTPDPSQIMQVGMGFWPSKTLLSAVELGLFTLLGSGSLDRAEIAEHLELRSRAVDDFLDGLVALRLLERDGHGEQARYRNTPDTAFFLDRSKPSLYRRDPRDGERAPLPVLGWPDRGPADRAPAERDQADGPLDVRGALRRPGSARAVHAGDDRHLDGQLPCACGEVRLLPLPDGPATWAAPPGILSILLAQRHPHLECISFDLPVVEPIAARTIEQAGLSDRVITASGDFFADPLPKADVVTMGMILHDWNLEKKGQLIRSAYEALPPGGAFIVIENLIDDERRENVFGLMMSLNMLIEFGDAFDYTGADFRRWCTDAGFRSVEILPLAGPASAGIAYK